MQELFASIDLERILQIEEEIAHDRVKALAYVEDPDKYMRNALQGKVLPDALHFHMRLDGELVPPDITYPDNQITFSSVIVLDSFFKEEVLKKARLLHPPRRGPGAIMYCDGCGQCKIAIIR